MSPVGAPVVRRLALLAVLALAACSSTPPPTRLMALPAPAVGSAASTGASVGRGDGTAGGVRLLAVRRLAIPEYLQSRALRYRSAGTELSAWPAAAWAERLEVALTRTLVERLRRDLPGWTVCDGACDDLPGALQLNVSFSELDYRVMPPLAAPAGSSASGRLQARAHWSVTAPGTGARWAGGWTLPEAAPGVASPDHQARELAGAAATLADDIAGVLAEPR